MVVLFWDFDGTLVHSDPLWSNSVYTALREADADTTVKFEDLRKCMAYGFTWHTPNENYSAFTKDAWWDFMNKHFYDSYIKCGVLPETAFAATRKIRSIIKNPENYILYDDAIPVLHTLKECGYVNVILSNNYPDLTEVLGMLDLLQYFDEVIISSVEGYDKPRKELFDIAKSKYPGAAYYMIGDSLKADVLGAKQAGMTTVLVHKGYFDEADYCFDDLISILKLLS